MKCAAVIFFVLFDRSVLEVHKKMDAFRHSLLFICIMSECTGDCILLFIGSIVVNDKLEGSNRRKLSKIMDKYICN